MVPASKRKAKIKSEKKFFPGEIAPAQFIPLLAEEFANDEAAKTKIRDTFATSKNLRTLNDIQWVIPYEPYADFMAGLIAWGRKFVTPAFFRWVNLFCGIALSFFALQLGLKLAQNL